MSEKTTERKSANNTSSVSAVEGTLTPEQFAQMQDAFKEHYKQMNRNDVYLACSIVNKFKLNGKPKLNKEGVPTGENWDDSYFVEITFDGGGFPVRVDSTQYQLLEIGNDKRYMASGKVTIFTNENGKQAPQLKITDFVSIF